MSYVPQAIWPLPEEDRAAMAAAIRLGAHITHYPTGSDGAFLFIEGGPWPAFLVEGEIGTLPWETLAAMLVPGLDVSTFVRQVDTLWNVRFFMERVRAYGGTL